jgi:TPR repeat protein
MLKNTLINNASNHLLMKSIFSIALVFFWGFSFSQKITADSVLQQKVNSKNTSNPDLLLNKGFDAYKLKNYDEARQLWEAAANADKMVPNKFRAMDELGNMYFRGEGVAKDDAKALDWYTKGGKGAPGKVPGNLNAAKSAGTLYENGYGAKQDFTKALEWYTTAKQLGNKYVDADIARIRKKIKGGGR